VIRQPPPENDASAFFSAFEEKVRRHLLAFYRSCDGLSWPDVRNGYFIEPFRRLVTSGERGEPEEVIVHSSSSPRKVLVFGSDGGGGRFLIDLSNSQVFHVTNGHLAQKSLKVEERQIRLIANNFEDFLLRLEEDLRAFIAGDTVHPFIA
jgi:hypothetical protein